MRMRWTAAMLAALALAAMALTSASGQTRFVDEAGNPIDEIRIEGNRRISAFEIRNAIGLGPDLFETAVAVMESILPLEEVNWEIKTEEDGRRVAVVTVKELPINKLDLLEANGFNRAHGYHIGARLEWTRRRSYREEPYGALYAEAAYGFSSKRWLHRWGGRVNLLQRAGVELNATVEKRRIADLRDSEEAPNPMEQGAMAMLFGHEFRDFYERTGSDIGAEALVDDGIHAARINISAERHLSLPKKTDWSLFRWRSRKYPITPIDEGRYVGLRLRYDYDLYPEWAAFVEIEHALPPLGSDFAVSRAAAEARLRRDFNRDILLLRLKGEAAFGEAIVQRSFIFGGSGSLLGYELHEFLADRGMLFNGEYRMRIFESFPLNLYALFFIDAAAASGVGLKLSGGYGFALENGVYVRMARGRFAAFDIRLANRF